MGRSNIAKVKSPPTENKLKLNSTVSAVNIKSSPTDIAGKRFHFIGAGEMLEYIPDELSEQQPSR